MRERRCVNPKVSSSSPVQVNVFFAIYRNYSKVPGQSTSLTSNTAARYVPFCSLLGRAEYGVVLGVKQDILSLSGMKICKQKMIRNIKLPKYDLPFVFLSLHIELKSKFETFFASTFILAIAIPLPAHKQRCPEQLFAQSS